MSMPIARHLSTRRGALLGLRPRARDRASAGRTQDPVIRMDPEMRACAIVPAYQAGKTVGEVVRALHAGFTAPKAILVIDDGSTDRTAALAAEAGARVVAHT